MRLLVVTSGFLLALISLPAAAQSAGEALRTHYDQTGKRVVVREVLSPARPCHDCYQVQPSRPVAPQPKLSPNLKTRLAAMTAGDTVRVVVSFPEDVTMPAFPPLRDDLPDSAPENLAIRNRRADVAAQLLDTRRVANRDRENGIQGAGMKIRDRFWISNSVLADATREAIEAAAALADVVHIQLDQTDVQPPTISQGRLDIRSDTIFNMATYTMTYWRTAMLDTGMPIRADGTKTHLLFSGLANMVAYDCVNTTDTNCTVAGPGQTINVTDDCWDHGTRTASIIVGTGSMGNGYRGVTSFPYIYGYKVYSQNGTGATCGTGSGLVTSAAQRAFQAAVTVGAKVIVAEIQDYQNSVLGASANNAYNAGVAVIAAAGNYSNESGVRSPAEAKMVLAVGAVDAYSLAQETYQSRGPQPDGRIKPEVQGPTNTTTAAATGCTTSTCTNVGAFSGTSGSTPYVGGAAELLGWWMNPQGTWVYPGYLYALLINLSNNYTDPVTNNTRGAGLLRLWPANGSMPGATGYVTLNQSTQYEYPVNIGTSGSFYDFTTSLWWPEGATQAHNQVHLAIVDPSGVVRATSTSGVSVFQKARVAGQLALGTWKIRITRQGGGAPGSQQVFFTLYYKQSTQWPD